MLPVSMGEFYTSGNSGTVTKAYVNYPNFEVLHDQGDTEITLLFQVENSATVGTVLRMKNLNMDDIERIYANLGSSIYVFTTDSDLVEALEKSKTPFTII